MTTNKEHIDEKVMMSSLSKDIVSGLPFKVPPITKEGPAQVVVKELTGDSNGLSKVEGKSVALSNPEKQKKKTKSKRKPLTSKEKRDLHLYDIPKEATKYSMYVQLHRLWTQYFDNLIQGDTRPQVIQPLLAKSDFHGAIMLVTRSKCPSYVGSSGIVIKETENTLNLVTKEDKLKAIPKKGTVFTIQYKEVYLDIYGDQIICRSGDRTSKKFKSKPTVEM